MSQTSALTNRRYNQTAVDSLLSRAAVFLNMGWTRAALIQSKWGARRDDRVRFEVVKSHNPCGCGCSCATCAPSAHFGHAHRVSINGAIDEAANDGFGDFTRDEARARVANLIVNIGITHNHTIPRIGGESEDRAIIGFANERLSKKACAEILLAASQHRAPSFSNRQRARMGLPSPVLRSQSRHR